MEPYPAKADKPNVWFNKPYDTTKATVVIIDDSYQVLQLLEYYLRKEDYNLILCTNGRDGIRLAGQYRPGIIICDWMMPEMDGLEVCKEIKKNPDLKSSCFMLLTAVGDVYEKVQAFETGVDDYIQKPPNILELGARIRAGLRLYNLNLTLRKKQRQLESELGEAAEYVLSLLPPPLDEQHSSGTRILLDWKFIPSTYLGGDIFSYMWHGSEQLILYQIDVAGHGIRAALLSVSIRNLLQSRFQDVELNQPAQVLHALNQYFSKEKEFELYFTMWYGVFDLNSKKLNYAGAGHPLAHICFESGKYLKLKNTAPPIGMLDNFDFTANTIDLPENTLLTLFSDGIYEPVEEVDQNRDADNWYEILARQPSRKSPFQISKNIDYLVQKAQAQNEGHPFGDDVSLLQLSLSF